MQSFGYKKYSILVGHNHFRPSKSWEYYHCYSTMWRILLRFFSSYLLDFSFFGSHLCNILFFHILMNPYSAVIKFNILRIYLCEKSLALIITHIRVRVHYNSNLIFFIWTIMQTNSLSAPTSLRWCTEFSV